MYKVDKAVVMARKHRLDEIAKLIQDQAYRIVAPKPATAPIRVVTGEPDF